MAEHTQQYKNVSHPRSFDFSLSLSLCLTFFRVECKIEVGPSNPATNATRTAAEIVSREYSGVYNIEIVLFVLASPMKSNINEKIV